MSFEVAKKLLDSLFEYRATGEDKIFKYLILDRDLIYNTPIIFDFFGGECTLYIDLLDQICSYFEELCEKYNYLDWFESYKISAETNGTTASNEKVKAFYEKYKNNLDCSVSLDGCKECHDMCRLDVNGNGTYDRTVEGVNILKYYMGKLPYTKQTFCKENMKYIKKSIEELYNMGYREIPGNFDCINLSQFLTPDESELYYSYLKETVDYIIDNQLNVKWSILYKAEMLSKYLDTFSRPICGADGSILAVKWDGSLYICAQLTESFILDKALEYCLGNVDDGITNLKMLDEFRSSSAVVFDYDCFDCPFAMACEPCPAKNLLITGNINHFKFNCGASLAELRALFYMIKRAKETNYPYFREYLDPIDAKWPDGLPERNYLLYRKEDSEE